ncbi:Tyrosinase [Sphaceloma murrayae]|uniref:Tyrosinase n=1 Tax=Sphaceloma murrayae TaxID=2082308 RepID=A0A2K1QQF1_9PEZI|nr:Tyrosinase [Sphaceloma murrayae]
MLLPTSLRGMLAAVWLLSIIRISSAGPIHPPWSSTGITKTNTSWVPDDTSGTDMLARSGLSNLQASMGNMTAHNCTIGRASRRREWHTLAKFEKLSYIAAVRCLQSLPSRMSDTVPGARTRYDDFVATHMQQTLSIHNNGIFLAWHRYYTYAYEQALVNECGYRGTQPYLNWGKLASDPLGAPVFDGSPTSISGNGAYRNNSGIGLPSPDNVQLLIPPYKGGDCITSGPFKNYQANLGPVRANYPYVEQNPQADGLGYNPRCLRRDINPFASASLYDQNTTDLITNSLDLATFQTTLNGDPAKQMLGVHAAGHFMIGGDPAADFYASPGDPFFFLHHAQVDRVWWIWQNQDLANREQIVSGTITNRNIPPSRDARLDDVIDLGVLAEKKYTLGESMSTVKGPFCYIYE